MDPRYGTDYSLGGDKCKTHIQNAINVGTIRAIEASRAISTKATSSSAWKVWIRACDMLGVGYDIDVTRPNEDKFTTDRILAMLYQNIVGKGLSPATMQTYMSSIIGEFALKQSIGRVDHTSAAATKFKEIASSAHIKQVMVGYLNLHYEQH